VAFAAHSNIKLSQIASPSAVKLGSVLCLINPLTGRVLIRKFSVSGYATNQALTLILAVPNGVK